MQKIFWLLLLLMISESYALGALPERHINKLNINVSFIGLGTVELGRDWGIGNQSSLHPTNKIAKQVLQTAYKHGVRVIDTATSYQLSEERIGKYLPRSQHEYLLITKPGEYSILASDPRCEEPTYDHIYCRKPGAAYDFSRAAIKKDIDESLKNLGVTQIDVVLLHLDSHTADNVIRKGEALATLQELKHEGKVKYIGVSINGEAARLAIETNQLDFIELEYNLLNQNNQKNIDLAYQKGIGVIVRGGLGTGLLTSFVAKHINDPNLPYGPQVRALLRLVNNDYDQLTALAFAFLYQNPHISTVIVGADQPRFIQKDLKLFQQRENKALLQKAVNVLSQFKTPTDFTEIMGEYYA